jgi:predicted Zn finger-like uncharacterized protein
MKIVCDACSAKYSIADEKVRGKVFKIRCKKCSNIIVVRGTDDGAAAAEQPPADEGGGEGDGGGDPDAVWHLVINQQQVGPMTPTEVRAHLDRGEIDAESYIWREGFGDWERISDVDPFTAWFRQAAPAQDMAAGGGLFGGGEDRASSSADPGDLFSARAAQNDAGGDLFAGGASSSAGGGMFGGGGAMTETGESRAASELKGQRSENSVLFSLNNLAALAGDSPRAAAPSSTSAAGGGGGGGMAGHATGEGSGLIDIRSMAQVYLGENQQRSSGSTPAGSIDDLPVFSQSSFDSASPVLMPMASGAGNNKLIVMLFAFIGVLIVVAAVLIIVVMKGGGDKPTEAVAMANGETTAGSPTTGTPAASPDKPAASGAAGAATEPAKTPEPAATAAAPAEADEPAAGTDTQAAEADKPTARPDRKPVERDSKRPERVTKASEPERPAPSPVPSAASGGDCDEVTCLVEPDKACCKKRGGKTSSPGRTSSSSAKSDLPEKPTRQEISEGIGAVRSRVMACGSKGTGTVTVRLKIGGSGSIDSADASGGSSSSLDSCVESAVKSARFPKSQRGLTVSYPFRF